MGALATLLNWLTPVLHPLTEFRANVTKLNTIHQDSIQTFSMLASGLVAPQAGPEAFTGELSDAFWAEMQTYLNAESALTGASVSVAEGGVIGEAIAVCEECATEVTGAAEVAAGEIAGDVVLDEITGIVDVAAVAEAGANPVADVAAIILTIVAGAALLATIIKLAWDIYNAVQQWQRMMHNIGDTPLPKLPPNPTPVVGPTPSLPPINMQQLTPQQQQEVNDTIAQLTKDGSSYSQSEIENLVKLGYNKASILFIIRQSPQPPVGQIPDKNVLLTSGASVDANGLTASGRAFQKHGSRNPGLWGIPKGNQGDLNKDGQDILSMIVNSPDTIWQVRHTGRFGYVVEAKLPDGRGARWSANGDKFIGFLDP